jgi:hypothetical protein
MADVYPPPTQGQAAYRRAAACVLLLGSAEQIEVLFAHEQRVRTHIHEQVGHASVPLMQLLAALDLSRPSNAPPQLQEEAPSAGAASSAALSASALTSSSMSGGYSSDAEMVRLSQADRLERLDPPDLAQAKLLREKQAALEAELMLFSEAVPTASAAATGAAVATGGRSSSGSADASSSMGGRSNIAVSEQDGTGGVHLSSVRSVYKGVEEMKSVVYLHDVDVRWEAHATGHAAEPGAVACSPGRRHTLVSVHANGGGRTSSVYVCRS